MKYKFLIQLFFLLLTSSYSVYGQYDRNLIETNETFVIGLGVPIFKIRDQGHSPLIYKGMSLSFYIGYSNYTPKSIFTSKLIFHSASCTPNYKPKAEGAGNKVSLSFIEVKNSLVNRIGNTTNYNDNIQFVGLSSSLLIDFRDYNLLANNTNGFYVGLTMGPAYRFSRVFDDLKYKANASIDMPLITFSLRPNYLGTLEFERFKLNKLAILKKFKIHTINKDFIINTDFNISKYFDRSYSTLGYNWMYHRNTVSKPLDMNYGGFYYNANFSR
jgi:hypothetical protein